MYHKFKGTCITNGNANTNEIHQQISNNKNKC